MKWIEWVGTARCRIRFITSQKRLIKRSIAIDFRFLSDTPGFVEENKRKPLVSRSIVLRSLLFWHPVSVGYFSHRRFSGYLLRTDDRTRNCRRRSWRWEPPHLLTLNLRACSLDPSIYLLIGRRRVSFGVMGRLLSALTAGFSPCKLSRWWKRYFL